MISSTEQEEEEQQYDEENDDDMRAVEELFLQHTEGEGVSLDDQIHNMHDQPSWYDLAERQMDANDGQLRSAFAGMGLDGQRDYMGMELFRRGQISRAIQVFEGIIQRSDRSDQVDSEEEEAAWRMLGSCHAEHDEDRAAITCLNRALDCDPYNLDALLALGERGTSYVNDLDSVAALETLKLWVAHNPKFAGLQQNLQQDEYSDGTLMDEVTQLMLSVASHAPLDVDVQVVLGVLYNVSQDYDSAVECFQTALQSRSDDYTLLNKLAATYANSNNSAQAVPHYSSALQLRPNYARGWLNLGIAYANMNHYDEAAKAYVQALHLNSNASHIWGYLRVVLGFMGRPDLVEISAKEDVSQLAEALNLQLLSESNS
eukprot:gene25769-32259_t